MRRNLKLLTALMALSATPYVGLGTAAAQATAPAETVAEEVVVTPATPPMWRVADADSEFILLGTFHILPPNVNWRTDSLEQAIAASESVYFEVDSGAPETQSKAINVVMLQGFNADGALLTAMLEEADAQKLRDITRSLGLPLAGVDPMRPWNAFLTLSVQFIVQQGFAPGAGLDAVLLAETRTLGKQLEFFESIDEQLALFTGLTPETEMALLVLTLRDWDNQTAGFAALYEAWRTGDVDAIDVMMNDAMREQAPEVYERLIVARNQAWVGALSAAIDSGAGTALVAVGAGHLTSGADSVPALLAAKGYEVSRYGKPFSAAPANDNAPTELAPAEEPPTDAQLVAPEEADPIEDLLESVSEQNP